MDMVGSMVMDITLTKTIVFGIGYVASFRIDYYGQYRENNDKFMNNLLFKGGKLW